jgi:hypothetical protein
MHTKTGSEAPLQPLPGHVQESVWAFVRRQIKHREAALGTRVEKFEIRVSDSGQIEVEVLSTQSENSAEIDEGLEEAGLKEEKVNRIAQREAAKGE